MDILTSVDTLPILGDMQNRKLLSIKKVAERLSVSPSTVRRILLRADIEATMIGDQWRIYEDSVDAYLRDHTYRRKEQEKQEG